MNLFKRSTAALFATALIATGTVAASSFVFVGDAQAQAAGGKGGNGGNGPSGGGAGSDNDPDGIFETIALDKSQGALKAAFFVRAAHGSCVGAVCSPNYSRKGREAEAKNDPCPSGNIVATYPARGQMPVYGCRSTLN